MPRFFYRLNFETGEALYCLPLELHAPSLKDAQDLAASIEAGISGKYELRDKEAPYLINEVTTSHISMTFHSCMASGRQEIVIRLWRVEGASPEPHWNIDDALESGLKVSAAQEIRMPLGIIKRKYDPLLGLGLVVDVVDLGRKLCRIASSSLIGTQDIHGQDE